MSDFDEFARRISSYVHDQRYRQEVEEEILDHLESAAREFEAEGLRPEEARRRAIAVFGNPDRVGLLIHVHGKDGGMMRAALRGAIFGAAITAGGFLAFFLILFGIVEPLRGYSMPDWSHGLNAWTYLALGATILGAAIGAVSRVTWEFFKHRRAKNI